MTEPRPVVITGMGVVSAAGLGSAALADALIQHRVCDSPVDLGLPVPGAAQVSEHMDDVDGFADDRKASLAFAALKLAQAQACVELGKLRKHISCQ